MAIVKQWQDLFLLLACFAIALLASLTHNVFAHSIVATFLFDSSHYLESCRQLTKLLLESNFQWQHLLSKQDPQLAQLIMLDGPILPLINVPIFLLLGRQPSHTDWQIFDFTGAVLQALSACFVFLIGRQLCKSNKWGFAAACAWAFYPSAIMSSGRFLNETPTALILLVLTFLASKLLDKKASQLLAWACAFGFFSGILLLMRPAVFAACLVLVFLVVAIRYAGKSSLVESAKIIAIIMIAICMTLAPWLAFTKSVTGHMVLSPQRVPYFNLAKGIDIEADGWSAEPTPPLTLAIANSAHPLADAASLVSKHPLAIASLMLRKINRLWGSPWNDSRQAVFGVSLTWQKWYHILLCLAALAGSMFVIAKKVDSDTKQIFLGYACVSLIILHNIYLLFEAIGRYNLTAMPFVIVLAIYFAYMLKQMRPSLLAMAVIVLPMIIFSFGCLFNFAPAIISFINQPAFALCLYYAIEAIMLVAFLAGCYLTVKNSKLFTAEQKILPLLIAGLSIVIVTTSACYALDSRNAPAWRCTLNNNVIAVRTFAIDADELKGKSVRSAFVLIDSDKSIAQADICLNGHLLTAQPLALFELYPERFFLSDLMRMYAYNCGLTFDDLRHYWTITIDPANLAASNTITIQAKKGQTVTIYGEYLIKDRLQQPFLSPDWFSPGHLDIEDGEGRLKLIPLAKTISDQYYLLRGSEKSTDDLAADPDRQSGRYRIQLALDLTPAQEKAQPSAKQLGSFTAPITAKDFDPLLRSHLNGKEMILVNRLVCKAAKGVTAVVNIPAGTVNGNYVRVSITGSIFGGNKKSKIGILPVMLGGQSWFMVLPRSPSYINATESWQPFEITDNIPVFAVQGGLKAVALSVYPAPWPEASEYGFDRANGQAFLKDLKLAVVSENRPEFERETTKIW